MSANSVEPYSAFSRLSKSAAQATPQFSERRGKARTRLHWPVILFRQQDGDTIESVTRDLSSSGFYYLTHVRFRAGELLSGSMKIPTHDPNGKLLERNLECKVRVVRVDAKAEGGFGVACAIEDYHLAHTIPHAEERPEQASHGG